MNKTVKIIVIAVTVLSLLLSIVTALNMDWDDGETELDPPAKDTAIDSESDVNSGEGSDEVPEDRVPMYFELCMCSSCNDPDYDIAHLFKVLTEDDQPIDADDLYIGNTVKLYCEATEIYVSTQGIKGEVLFSMRESEYKTLTLEAERYYVWTDVCESSNFVPD